MPEPRTMVEELCSTPEGLAAFQQEKTILEVTELMCREMRLSGVSRAELAQRLGTSQSHVTMLLDGRRNMTLRTVADIMTALGREMQFRAGPLKTPGS
jgi:plasmid maintenance system antidote protein VapI